MVFRPLPSCTLRPESGFDVVDLRDGLNPDRPAQGFSQSGKCPKAHRGKSPAERVAGFR